MEPISHEVILSNIRETININNRLRDLHNEQFDLINSLLESTYHHVSDDYSDDESKISVVSLSKLESDISNRIFEITKERQSLSKKHLDINNGFTDNI